MGGYPFFDELANAQQQGVSEASSAGVALAALTAANTKSAWAEIVSATPIDACMVDIGLTAAAQSGEGMSVDIALGAAGAERIICPDLFFAAPSSHCGGAEHYFLPLAIPAGSRISARWQCVDLLADVISVGVTLFAGGFNQSAGFVGLDTYGFDAGGTHGIALADPSADNTPGAWTEITPGLVNDVAGFMAHFDASNSLNNTAGATSKLIDIGIGPAGSEQIIIPQFQIVAGGATSIYIATFPPKSPLYGMALPAATRIAARHQAADVSHPYANTGVIIYGLRA